MIIKMFIFGVTVVLYLILFVFNNLLLLFIGQLRSQNLSFYVQLCLLLKQLDQFDIKYRYIRPPSDIYIKDF